MSKRPREYFSNLKVADFRWDPIADREAFEEKERKKARVNEPDELLEAPALFARLPREIYQDELNQRYLTPLDSLLLALTSTSSLRLYQSYRRNTERRRGRPLLLEIVSRGSENLIMWAFSSRYFSALNLDHQLLCAAVERGNINIFKFILRLREIVNVDKPAHLRTPRLQLDDLLVTAAAEGHLDLAKSILPMVCGPLTPEEHANVMNAAAARGQIEILQWLFSKDPQFPFIHTIFHGHPFIVPDSYESALVKAAAHGHLSSLLLLNQQLNRPIPLTALIRAAREGQVDLLKALIKEGDVKWDNCIFTGGALLGSSAASMDFCFQQCGSVFLPTLGVDINTILCKGTATALDWLESHGFPMGLDASSYDTIFAIPRNMKDTYEPNRSRLGLFKWLLSHKVPCLPMHIALAIERWPNEPGLPLSFIEQKCPLGYDAVAAAAWAYMDTDMVLAGLLLEYLHSNPNVRESSQADAFFLYCPESNRTDPKRSPLDIWEWGKEHGLVLTKRAALELLETARRADFYLQDACRFMRSFPFPYRDDRTAIKNEILRREKPWLWESIRF